MTSCRFPPPWSVKEADSKQTGSTVLHRPPWHAPMRFRTVRAIAILVVMLTLLFLGGQAKAKSLGEFKVDCEELENFWRLYPPTKDSTLIPGQAGAAICFGYMDVVGGPLCGHTLGICLPKGSSYSQVLAVFLAHTRSHPAQWHEDAAPQFQLAFMTAFPCKDEMISEVRALIERHLLCPR
jgi:hypothetical protein